MRRSPRGSRQGRRSVGVPSAVRTSASAERNRSTKELAATGSPPSPRRREIVTRGRRSTWAKASSSTSRRSVAVGSASAATTLRGRSVSSTGIAPSER
jgi:hypothetical protein